jgi:hypothetical protein
MFDSRKEDRMPVDRPGSKPHLLVLSGVWPHVVGNREAANVIAHEIVSQLADSGRFRLTYGVINARDTARPEAAAPEIDRLAARGVRFLEPVRISAVAIANRWWQKLIAIAAGRPDRVVVGIDRHPELISRLAGDMPDAVMVIWAEQAGYVASQLPCIRFNYAGNPDHKVLAGRLELAARLERSSFQGGSVRRRLLYHVVRLAHLMAMRRYDLMWNVAANDAADYARAGVSARYIQNMWPNAVSADWEERRSRSEQLRPLKIVGNVGNLDATGNSFGLLTIAENLVPALKRQLGEGGFEIHLFGGGRPHPSVAPLLAGPHLLIRGFVDDLDAEILSAPIFLVANNSRSFKVGHTRFLHAWSLGACVVGFSDSIESMPEIRHGENALMGETPEEVAELIVRAAKDPQLRKRVAAGGMETLQRFFAPPRIVEQMMRDIETTLAQRRSGDE